jgi:hypothetical protein
MKNESVISRIISAIKGNKVAVRENLFYDTVKGMLDFAPDDIPNWRAVNSVVPVAPPAPTPIVAGTDATPKVIAYNLSGSPSYMLIRGSDNSFDWNTNVQYDGINFTILGADNGSGKFADSFMFYIRP